MKFPIALQLYSVRKEMTADPAGTLRAVKEMGYDGVEFAGMYGCTPAALKALCGEIGLVPLSGHVGIDELVTPGVIADYAAIGCRFLAVPWLDEARRPGNPGYEGFLAQLQTALTLAAENDITLLYHNHNFEFVKVGDDYALDALYRRMPTLGTELDTCWISIAGENPVDYIRKYHGRAPVLHLKDYIDSQSADSSPLTGAKNEQKAVSAFEFRPVGMGIQDFPAILAAAEEAGTEWVVVEQDMPSLGLTPTECAKKSIDYLRSL